jgi:type IV secretory pathway TraG/TraD family ATPase VirD4
MLTIVVGFIVFAIFVRQMSIRGRNKRIAAAYKWNPNKAYASARFATAEDLGKAKLFGSSGLFFGFSPDGLRRLFYQKTGHMLVVCAARGGKLLTLLVSLIMRLGRKYSLFLLDPKLEMTPIIAKARRTCGKLFVWNPYGLHRELFAKLGIKQCRINPVADIDPDSISCYADCRKLLSTFWDQSTKGDDLHWLHNGLDLATTTLYTLRKFGKREEANLPTLRMVLTGGSGVSFFEFVREAMKIPDRYIRQGFQRFAEPDAKESKELMSILSVAHTQTAWIGNPVMTPSLMHADCSLMDMKTKKGMTFCAGLPLDHMDDTKSVAMVSGWLLRCAVHQGSLRHTVPCVAVIDEMSKLGEGPSRQWYDAFSYAAGAGGLQIVGVYQDAGQIARQFGHDKNALNGIIQNCGVTLWFNIRDTFSRETVSALAGTREVITQQRSVTIDHLTGEPHVSDSGAQASVPLIAPFEVGLLDDRTEMIAFVEGVPAVIKGKRKPYTQIESGYGENPYYRRAGFWKSILNWR